MALETGVETLVPRAGRPGGGDRRRRAGAPRTGRGGAAGAGGGARLDRSSPDLQAAVRGDGARLGSAACWIWCARRGQAKRSSARFMSYGVNAAGLMGDDCRVRQHRWCLSGTEFVVAGGTSALSQKLLEALLGDQAVRSTWRPRHVP